MGNTTRYGLIGCGMMGQEHLRNIALLPEADVAAIFEPDATMRARAMDIAPDARLHESLDDLLSAPDLDCLLVASPNHLHAQQLRRIAEINPLPLLMEKPLFTDMEDYGFVSEVQDTYPAPIWVAMEYRYMPVIAKLVEEVRTMQLAGDMIHMLTIREHRFPFLEKVGDWNRFNRKTGGTLVEKCCHFFDLMSFILRSRPVRVFASGGQGANHLDESYDGETPDILDNAYVVLDYENGSRAMLDLCMFADGSKFQEYIAAVGSTQKVECRVPGPQRFWPVDDLGDPPVAEVTVSRRDPRVELSVEVPVDPELLDAGDHNGSTFYQHRKFLDVVRRGGEVEVDLSAGIEAVLIGKAAQHSIATGEAVDLTKGPFASEVRNRSDLHAERN